MGYLTRRACRPPLTEPLPLAMLSSREATRSRTMQAAPTQGTEAVPNESAPAVVVAEEDFTTRLHQVNVERAVSFLNCMERIMFSCTAKGCRGAVSAAAIYYRLGACRGVGCLRATCMAQHRASLCRGKPLVELPLDDGEKVYVRFQHSLRIWTRRYVLPRLDRPLTTLTLPRFDRPEVLLACLAEARARVSIVYITDAIYWRHEGDEDPLVLPSDMWSAGTGMTKPKHVVLLPPASGISALVIQEGSEVDWRAVLQHTPNLRYLSMRACPSNAEYFSGALSLVPQIKYLDLGYNWGHYYPDCGIHIPIYELLRNASNLEVFRCTKLDIPAGDVRRLKRTCCPRLREIHMDESNWSSTPMPLYGRRVILDCDGVLVDFIQ